jgi:6-phosphogluconolactonase
MSEKSGSRAMDPVVYVGSYTNTGAKHSEGIYVYRLNMQSGALSLLSAVNGGENPSYLTLDPKQRFVYTVNETSKLGEEFGGGVSALAIDPASAKLTCLNQQLSHGTSPCYVSVEPNGRYAFVSNYSSGSIAMFPILADGRLDPASDIVQHHGSGMNQRRQERAHAHCIVVDPTSRFLFVADLGIDKVMVYKMDLEHGKMIHTGEAGATQGAGPRHLTFHPNGEYAYLIHELNGTMTAFAYHAENGMLEALQTLSTLPEDYHGYNMCADVHVAPSGRYLYGSNRGHDSIVIYAIDEHSGRMALVGHESTRGKTPRNFAIDPGGQYLLAANQDTNDIVTFKIDADSGKLSEIGQVTQVAAPVCIKFVQPG